MSKKTAQPNYTALERTKIEQVIAESSRQTKKAYGHAIIQRYGLGLLSIGFSIGFVLGYYVASFIF